MNPSKVYSSPFVTTFVLRLSCIDPTLHENYKCVCQSFAYRVVYRGVDGENIVVAVHGKTVEIILREGCSPR